MADRRVEGQWIGGQWVPTGVAPVKGSGDTSATTRARFGNVGGVGSVKSKPWPKRADYPSDEAWQAAYDARRKEQLAPAATPSPAPPQDKVSVIMVPRDAMPQGQMMTQQGPMASAPMAGGAPSPEAQQMLLEELRRRYGGMSPTMAGFYPGGMA